MCADGGTRVERHAGRDLADNGPYIHKGPTDALVLLRRAISSRQPHRPMDPPRSLKPPPMEPPTEGSSPLATPAGGPSSGRSRWLEPLSDTRKDLGHLCHTLDELRAYVTALYNNRVLGNTPENLKTDYLERLSLHQSLRELSASFGEQPGGPYVVDGDRLLEIDQIASVDVRRQVFEVKWRNSQVPFDRVVGLPNYARSLIEECARNRDGARQEAIRGGWSSPAPPFVS